MRIFQNASFPFLEWRRRAYLVTGVVLAVGIGAMVMNALNPNIGSWLKYGVDFTGGTLVQVSFDAPTDVERIRSAAGEHAWEIQSYGSDSEYVIRTPSFTQGTDADAQRVVTEVLGGEFEQGSFAVTRTEAVGPKVGEELQQRGL